MEVQYRHGLPFYKKPAVYKIRNKVNGKLYVGSACKSLWGRLKNHVNELNRDGHKNPHLQASWKKYGADAFEWTILEFCTRETATEREQWWIDELDGYKTGYNRCPTAGSRLGTKQSDETKEKCRVGNLGKKHSAESCAKMSESHKKRLEDPEERKKHAAKVHWSKGPNAAAIAAKIGAGHKGMKHTEEAKAKNRVNHLGRKHTDEMKAKTSAGHWSKGPKAAETRAKYAKNSAARRATKRGPVFRLRNGVMTPI